MLGALIAVDVLVAAAAFSSPGIVMADVSFVIYYHVHSCHCRSCCTCKHWLVDLMNREGIER